MEVNSPTKRNAESASANTGCELLFRFVKEEVRLENGLTILVAIGFAVSVGAARGEKPLKDYSFIRGVNYGMNGDQATIERDLGYAKRINLNSTRIWLSYKAYEEGSARIYYPAAELHSRFAADGHHYGADSV